MPAAQRLKLSVNFAFWAASRGLAEGGAGSSARTSRFNTARQNSTKERRKKADILFILEKSRPLPGLARYPGRPRIILPHRNIKPRKTRGSGSLAGGSPPGGLDL